MSTVDLTHARWFKSSRSADNGSCVEAAFLPAEAHWHKSSRSQANGTCVEAAFLTAHVAVRDSKNIAGPALVFPAADWRAFLAARR